MNRFVRVAALADVPAGRARLVAAHGASIALFNVGGEVYALDDSCPHAGSSLAAGRLDGAMVACRAHGLRFDVRTGRMRGAAGLCAKSYPVRIVGNEVAVEIDVQDAAVANRGTPGDTEPRSAASMYRHLMIPLDDSPLTVETVRVAVEFARALGAKVTFFHAKSDYGSSSVGALERVMSPTAFNENIAGEARALLAKAEVVAREAGVAFDSLVVTSDRPHEAILDAAEARGCDLIFMASHGRRGVKGLMLGSQTQKVLQHTTIPVLVSAVESNVAAPAHFAAATIIRDEHRSLAAVVHGLEYVVREARDAKAPPRFALLRAMLHYIKAFPETLHHPKEDAYLFRKLRERTSEFNDTLDELERQHVAGHALVAELERALDAYEADPARGHAPFAAAVERFAGAQWAHMNLETKVIMPAAQKHLTADDWSEISRAFAQNGDPRFNVDADEEFRQLFANILNLAPAQIVGNGDRARS
jgi:nucleotide-binding universal stress UspA family protein/nitrite reductase/ring-hydroxylating ferredoxin subunit/hemerythrin-like domain-containing protein